MESREYFERTIIPSLRYEPSRRRRHPAPAAKRQYQCGQDLDRQRETPPVVGIDEEESVDNKKYYHLPKTKDHELNCSDSASDRGRRDFGDIKRDSCGVGTHADAQDEATQRLRLL
jgi:hypothetical protein